MTISEYLNGLPDMVSNDGTTLKETMLDTVEIWNNDSCKGYAIAAMQQAGFDREQIRAVLSKMRWAFDETTIEQAARIYIDF